MHCRGPALGPEPPRRSIARQTRAGRAKSKASPAQPPGPAGPSYEPAAKVGRISSRVKRRSGLESPSVGPRSEPWRADLSTDQPNIHRADLRTAVKLYRRAVNRLSSCLAGLGRPHCLVREARSRRHGPAAACRGAKLGSAQARVWAKRGSHPQLSLPPRQPPLPPPLSPHST